MKGMTGYGYSERLEGDSVVSAEIKSYNHRYLDINVYVPPSLTAIEPRIRETVGGRVARGRVEVYVKARGVAERSRVVLDRANLEAYLDALGQVREAAGLEDRIELSDLLGLEGVLRLERTADVDTLWSALAPVLDGAIEQLDAARRSEGDSTRRDILAQLDRIEAAVRVIKRHAPQLEERIKSQIRERFEEVAPEHVDENRIYAETAVLLVKYSINEEIVRLDAHLASMRDLADATESAGKRLDFISQEVNREINTIGSKSIVTEVNQAVIEAKDSLENIREQLRNVE